MTEYNLYGFIAMRHATKSELLQLKLWREYQRKEIMTPDYAVELLRKM